MSNDAHQGPARRWVHEGPGGDLDAELGKVFRATAEEEPLTSVELARVGRRLVASRSRRSRPVFRLLPVMLAVLTGGAGAALAQWARPGIWDFSGLITPRSATSIESAGAARAGEAKRPPHRQGAPVAVAPEPAALAREAPLASSERKVEAPQSSVARGTAPSADEARPNAVALESELMQRALEKLRRDDDAAAALRLLDEHGARFPGGVLALEAAVARVDALLMLGRRGEALERLSRLPLARVGRRVELQLLRAELQAERDCGKALSDFDAVLSASPAAAFGERALYGRASCRLRLGDAAGGRADLDQYLKRYPRGRFAGQVRARVAEAPR